MGEKYLIDFMISLTPQIPEDWTSDENEEEEILYSIKRIVFPLPRNKNSQ